MQMRKSNAGQTMERICTILSNISKGPHLSSSGCCNLFVNHNYIKIFESDWSSAGLIYNGNRTEWSPIRSVIIRVINKIAKWESDLLITSMITDRIGRHDILLPINHNHYNFRKTESFNWKKKNF